MRGDYNKIEKKSLMGEAVINIGREKFYVSGD